MNFFTSRNNNAFIAIFSALIILEICFNVYFHKGTLGQTANAFGLFGVSVASGLFVLFAFYKKQLTLQPVSKNIFSGINAFIWLAGLAVLGFFLNSLWHKNPITAGASDIIPTLEVAVKRFLNGEMPYKKISKWGYDLPLTYLPMQWGPYILPEVLHFDYRWIGLGINAIAGFWLIRQSTRSKDQAALLIPLLLIFNWAMLLVNNDGILANTIEVMVAGYYMLLIAGLWGNNAVLKGLIIGCCMLSRYSMVLWMPLWFFTELVSGNRKQLLITIGVTGAFVLVLYVVPFLSKDSSIFMDGYKYYTTAAIGEWQHLNDQGQPYHLFDGQGFAYLFYSKLTGYTIPDRIHCLQKVHLAACLMSTGIMGIWYWFNRKNINYKVFLLGSFKIYFSIFLVFIQVPYAYLMITGTFVSIAMLAMLLQYKVRDASQPLVSN